MANSTIPGLAAVTVPALTDLFGVRQSGDTRDKKLTVTQLLTLIPSGGDVTKVGTPADNQLGVWTGDGTIEGTNSIAFDGSTFTMNLGGGDLRLTGKLELQGSNRPAVLDESASNTNPTFAPLGNSPTSGLGGQGSSVSLIAFSKPAIEVTSLNAQILQAYETSRTVTAFAGGGQGSATILGSSFNILTTVASPADSVKLPALFQGNDPCTVIYIKNDGANAADVFPATGDDLGSGTNVAVSVAAGESVSFIATSGSSTWTPFIVDTSGGGGAQISGTPANNQLGVWVNSTDIEGDSNWQVVGTLLRGALGNGPGMVNLNGINILPRHGDPNTGLQNVGDDRLAMVAGGVAGLTLIEASSAVLPTYQTNVGITAFATGGQTSATQLNSGYNVVDTVATTGDSVKFSSLVNVGSIVFVKNDGANALDLFPAGGDDLGFGVGVALSVGAGATVAFLGSVLSSTWTQLIFESGAVDISALTGGANNGMLFKTGGVWTDTQGSGLEFDGSSMSFDNTDIDMTSGSSLNIDDAGGVLLQGSSGISLDSTGQIAAANAAGFALVNEAASATNPTLIPNKTDLDTGIGWGASLDELILVAGGVEALSLAESGGGITVTVKGPTTFEGNVLMQSATGASLQNISATATVPTVVPSRADLDTGLGSAGANILSLIAGGAEIARARNGGTLATQQFIISPGALGGEDATPSLAFGDGNTGFRENPDNTLEMIVSGGHRFNLTATTIEAQATGGPALLNEDASATNPAVLPDKSDTDTGLGQAAADQLSLIAGGVEGLTIAESGGVITNTFRGDLVAAGGGGAGPALLNTSASPSVPTIIPNQADPNTGLTRSGIDEVALIAGGLDVIRCGEVASARTLGFYTTAAIAQQTGVAVSSAGIHAALVALGLITA